MYIGMGMYIPFTSGYEGWLFFASAVWAFDRLILISRVLKMGSKRAKVADLGEAYMRVDIPGVRWGSDPGQHVFVYFPVLSLFRPWENHLFSIIPIHMTRNSNCNVSDESGQEDMEKKQSRVTIESNS
jgi:hypothetical protein